MTKRDYVLIAEVIKGIGEDAALSMDSAADRVQLAQQFALALEATNPRFDAQRFIAAACSDDDIAESLEDQYA